VNSADGIASVRTENSVLSLHVFKSPSEQGSVCKYWDRSANSCSGQQPVLKNSHWLGMLATIKIPQAGEPGSQVCLVFYPCFTPYSRPRSFAIQWQSELIKGVSVIL